MSTLIKMSDKVLGRIENRVYTTERNRDKHFFKKFNGYGISKIVIEVLQKEGVINVIFRDEYGEYIIFLDNLISKGKEWDFWGENQIVIPLEECRKL